jgi:hypothetical protein
MPGELAVDRPNRKSRAGISLFPIRIHRKKAAAVTAILTYARYGIKQAPYSAGRESGPAMR